MWGVSRSYVWDFINIKVQKINVVGIKRIDRIVYITDASENFKARVKEEKYKC